MCPSSTVVHGRQSAGKTRNEACLQWVLRTTDQSDLVIILMSTHQILLVWITLNETFTTVSSHKFLLAQPCCDRNSTNHSPRRITTGYYVSQSWRADSQLIPTAGPTCFIRLWGLWEYIPSVVQGNTRLEGIEIQATIVTCISIVWELEIHWWTGVIASIWAGCLFRQTNTMFVDLHRSILLEYTWNNRDYLMTNLNNILQHVQHLSSKILDKTYWLIKIRPPHLIR